MKINLSDFEEQFDDFGDKWERRERKVNNRSKLKAPPQNKEKEKKEQKSLTKIQKESIIEE